jgi:surfeit locus 1 family protein
VAWARRDWLLVGVAVVVALVCVRLGVWQLDRLRERRARNAAVRAARELPPLALPRPGLTADSVRYRRVVAVGVYDYAWERLWRPRIYDGVVGVGLVTPLRLADGAAVLVDRGWVPAPSGAAPDVAGYRAGDSIVTVDGFAMPAPRAPGDVDPVALADSLPYPLVPFVVQLPPGAPSGPALPLRVPLPALDDGPHRSYAFQWFSFAAIALVGTAFLLRREHRPRSGA